MTLIDYHRKFWKEYRKKTFTPNETLLFSYLLDEWNNSGRKELFECNTKEIELVLGMNKMTLSRCRENLRKRGVIQYVRGNRKVNSPYYSFEDVTNNVTNNVTKDVTNSVTNDVTTHRVLREEEKEIISKDITKKENNLSYCLPSFIPIMEEWLEYKRNRKEMYKTPASIRKCYNSLLALSDSNPTTAQQIIDQSMANNWAGLFKLKNNGAITNQNSGGNNNNSGAVQNQFSDYLRENFGFNGKAEDFEEWFNQNPYGG